MGNPAGDVDDEADDELTPEELQLKHDIAQAMGKISASEDDAEHPSTFIDTQNR